MNVDFHILICLFLCPVSIYCPLFWYFVVCLSSVMIQPSSHKTPKDISGDAFVSGKMLIFLDSLDSPVISKVATCVDSVVMPSGSFSSMVCSHLTGSIVGVSLLEKCMLAPEAVISMFVLKL